MRFRRWFDRWEERLVFRHEARRNQRRMRARLREEHERAKAEQNRIDALSTDVRVFIEWVDSGLAGGPDNEVLDEEKP